MNAQDREKLVADGLAADNLLANLLAGILDEVAILNQPRQIMSNTSNGTNGSVNRGTVFPPYGHSKGQPVTGASMSDLQFYRGGCLRTLDDPAKSRWHDKEKVLLAAIEAEIARQQNARPDPAPSFNPDDDVPF